MKIRNVAQLVEAARSGKAVICHLSHAFGRPLPAGFIIHMPAIRVQTLIDLGLQIYTKPKKPVPKFHIHPIYDEPNTT